MRALELMQVPAIAELGELLFPVSTITKPSFAVMVHMMGHGDRKVCQASPACSELRINYRQDAGTWPRCWFD